MIVRHFLNWARTAPSGIRADATCALARAYLYSDMSGDDRIAAEGALLMLLDDASPLVRRAMADVFARSPDAPPAIVLALSQDQADVAAPVLEYSPLLIDADLVDLAATASGEGQAAIARREQIPAQVSAALAEVGTAEACLELVENPGADIADFSLMRIVERFGHLAVTREAILMREDLAPAIRLAAVEKLTETLSGFVVSRNWLAPERAQRLADESRERARVAVAASVGLDGLAALVAHLREAGHLTAGLVLRALLCGNLDLFNAAMAELTGLPAHRVAGLAADRSGATLSALFRRAGLPASTIPAFREALFAIQEIGFVGSEAGQTRLRRAMVERVLTRIAETRDADCAPILILLRRFAAEAAREEARLYCEELVSEEALSAPATLHLQSSDDEDEDDLIAA